MTTSGAPDVPCGLCGRHVPHCLVSLHHLLPRAVGGGAEDRVPLCRICHAQLHALFTNRTLAEEYSSLEDLRRAPEVRKFIRWVRRQKPHRRIKVSRSSAKK